MMHRQLTTVSRHGEPQSRSNHACSALLGRSGPCLTTIRRPPPPAMSTRSERRHKGGRGQCTCKVDHAVILTRKLSLCGAAARMYSTAGKEKIAMIGSGNFGSALVRILGRNALDKPETFDPKVSMYVHEEMIDGKPLTQIINETNENVKYLKGAKFTPNVVAEPSLEKAVEGATMVCFCLPHQFLKPLMPAIKVTDAVRQPVRGAAGGGWRWRRRWWRWRRRWRRQCGVWAGDHPQ